MYTVHLALYETPAGMKLRGTIEQRVECSRVALVRVLIREEAARQGLVVGE